MKKPKYSEQFMEKMGQIADYLLLGTLCLIGSIPVFTIGLSISATYKAFHDRKVQADRGILSSYLIGLKGSWKQAIPIWLVYALVCLSFYLNQQKLLLNGFWMDWAIQIFLGLVLLLLTPIVLIALAYIARFEDKLSRVVENSFVLSLMFMGYSFRILLVFLLVCVMSYLLPMFVIVVFPLAIHVLYGDCEAMFSQVNKTVTRELDE